MIKKLSHIGIAVKDLAAAEKLFSTLLKQSTTENEEVKEQGVKLGFVRVGDVSIELTQPTAPESPVQKFIEKRGEGVHHVSFEVDDIRAELARLKQEGFQLIDSEPRIGAGGHWIAFIHPKSTRGVLVELCQKRD
jgi:methylmalonyl-CoA/ethylmalonyl-CoA epimerase